MPEAQLSHAGLGYIFDGFRSTKIANNGTELDARSLSGVAVQLRTEAAKRRSSTGSAGVDENGRRMKDEVPETVDDKVGVLPPVDQAPLVPPELPPVTEMPPIQEMPPVDEIPVEPNPPPPPPCFYAPCPEYPASVGSP